MLFALSREYIVAQRITLPIIKHFQIRLLDDQLVDPNNKYYFITPQQTTFQGLVNVTNYHVIENDKQELLFVIDEINNVEQKIIVNLSKQEVNKIEKHELQSIKKKIQKQKIQLMRNKNEISKKLQPEEEKEEQIHKIKPLTVNELSYLQIMQQLSDGISKKYIIQYFKNRKDNRIVRYIYPQEKQIENQILLDI